MTSFCFIFSGIFEVAVGRAELSDTAHPLLVWAAPYHEMIGPYASLYAACYDGVAARHHLDMARAETSFRRAFEIGCGVALIRMPRASPVRFSADALRDRRFGHSHASAGREPLARSRGRRSGLPAARYVNRCAPSTDPR